MKDKRKIGIIVTIVVMLLTVFGITYAFINYTLLGNKNSVLVTGDIYMNYTESNQINLENAIPMSKDEALQLDKNTFSFTITGKNQSKKDIYYGISIVYGDEENSKTRLKDEDIDVYLTSGEDVLVNANRYKTLDDTRIWVEKINANTEKTYTKDYSLRMWVDDSVTISDTEGDYTQDVWNNSYASFKVKVDGNLDKMNMPVEIDAKDSYFENGKAYFIVNISNYLNPHEAGIKTVSLDTMKLDISSSNKDVVFTYQDDTGNKVDAESSTLSQTYTFEENKVVKIQVYVTSKNVEPINADINIKVTKNENETIEMLKTMSLRGANEYYCQNNGFTKLADCLLVSEQYSKDVESAKLAIEKKGAPTLSKTAPEITYIATPETPGATVPQNSAYNWTYGDSVTFNTSTGEFTITGNVNKDQSLSSAMNGKWTCGTSNVATIYCDKVYHITSMEGNTIKSASSRTYQIANAIGSEVGLYQTADDVGDTFYYRGDVENNNVKFAGFYWKIIRVNGDGSIRLLYNGTKANETGMESSSVIENGGKYNESIIDPTYVGYMYGDNFSDVPVKSKVTRYVDIQANTRYYFAKEYTSDNETKTFKLSEDNYYGTFTEWNTNKKLDEGYKYTCKLKDAEGTCQFLLEITKFTSASEVNAYIFTFGSTSYANTRADNASSNAKTTLENWYITKLAGEGSTENGKAVTDYIETNATFCNDRSLSIRVGNGDGYATAPATYYGMIDRITDDKKASLKCPTVADLFSADRASKGNGKLSKPIGLLIADEVAFAGGVASTKNERYYLYTGVRFWTMTPGYFDTKYVDAVVSYVDSNGELQSWGGVGINFGLRAVINLKKEVLLAGGNGTMDDPYTVKLAS